MKGVLEAIVGHKEEAGVQGEPGDIAPPWAKGVTPALATRL
jgi:hypothetical protein